MFFNQLLQLAIHGGGKRENRYSSEGTGKQKIEIKRYRLLPQQQKEHCDGQLIGYGLQG